MEEITLPKNLKFYRIAMRQTQDGFASSLGIKEKTYTAYESGRAEPPINTLLNMARTMGITVDDLCFGDLSKVQPQRTNEAQKGEGS